MYSFGSVDDEVSAKAARCFVQLVDHSAGEHTSRVGIAGGVCSSDAQAWRRTMVVKMTVSYVA